MIVVFTGPTLPAEEVRRHVDALVMPPASQGDIYNSARHRVKAIGLIDGYFERVPAVWHKEILWAMSQGVHVYGAASMGALRAAELDAFGMVGVGSVYEGYAAGELEDDDEVAVTHGPAGTGYVGLSEAMVNIRATLHRAASECVVSEETLQGLLTAAKALHFAERTYGRLLEWASTAGLPHHEIIALGDWLPGGRLNVKRDDAVALLELLREESSISEPKRVRYSFQNTTMWQSLVNEIERRPLRADDGAEALPPDAVLDELRLLGTEHYKWVRERATVRVLALELAERIGIDPGEHAMHEAVSALRLELGLIDENAVERWLERQELTARSLEHLLRDQVRLGHVRHMTSRRLDMFIRDQLKSEGRFGELDARSRLKQGRLASRGLENPTPERAGVTEHELWSWYFARLGAEPPDDIGGFADSMDFSDERHFRRVVLREYCFAQDATEGEHETDEGSGERRLAVPETDARSGHV